MPLLTGWLLDLYLDPDGQAALWLLEDHGQRLRLDLAYPLTFYAAGPARRLRQAWTWLRQEHPNARLSRVEHRDLFQPAPLPMLAVWLPAAGDQPRLFVGLQRAFPDLTYYDADLPLALRLAASHGLFPLARCQADADEEGCVQQIRVLDTPWELDPLLPALRVLEMEPDSDPSHRTPSAVIVRRGQHTYRFPLEPARSLLTSLTALLTRYDPDLLLTNWGDTWLLPRLLELSKELSLPLPLNRDSRQAPARREEHSYFSYGQIVYRGEQVHLFGRWHIDRHNALFYNDLGLEGILEFARVTALPVQQAARLSPGTGISAMQIITAQRLGVGVPWHKQQSERPKSALELLHRDQGGLIYQPLIGLHQHVAELDFVSMYPSLMVRFNISPETAGDQPGNPQGLEPYTSELLPVLPPAEAQGERRTGSETCGDLSHTALTPPERSSGAPPPGVRRRTRGEGGKLQDLSCSPPQPGLVPQTLAPLLEKRLQLKTRVASLPVWDARRRPDQARAAAHKWLLVTCFGYLGYKNARFGRIEAHEAVTAYGREALLRAKEAAEDLGAEVLHMYVDGMWVLHPDWATPQTVQPLLEEIALRTGLSISLEGIYRWIVFLPSRVDADLPVANRYFGVFQDGSLKVRGIEMRRRDTPTWIATMQAQVLEILAQAPTLDALPGRLPAARRCVEQALADLRRGRVALEDLLVAQKLSRELSDYRTPSPAARAAAQMLAAGKTTRPGQRVRFLFTRGAPGVWAWDRPEPPDPRTLDLKRYEILLRRAADTVLEPFADKANCAATCRSDLSFLTPA